MTTALAACPRCHTRLMQVPDDYPHCLTCGHYDYGPLTEASKWQVETPRTYNRNVIQNNARTEDKWVYETTLKGRRKEGVEREIYFSPAGELVQAMGSGAHATVAFEPSQRHPLSMPPEHIRIVITYMVQKNPTRTVAVVLGVEGWPWHRWSAHKGSGGTILQAFRAELDLELIALPECLMASSQAGWAERQR